MKVISVEVPVQAPCEKVTVEWTRGDKVCVTKNQFELTPEKPLALVNETFTKNSIFYKINKTDNYQNKMAILKVKGICPKMDMNLRVIGDCEINITQSMGK